MAEEQLRLVRDFGELRAGMIVVMRSCSGCGGGHRGMLTHLRRSERHISPEKGLQTGIPVWDYLPSVEHEGSLFVVSEASIIGRRCYRVLDGLSTPSETRTTRKRERVR